MPAPGQRRSSSLAATLIAIALLPAVAAGAPPKPRPRGPAAAPSARPSGAAASASVVPPASAASAPPVASAAVSASASVAASATPAPAEGEDDADAAASAASAAPVAAATDEGDDKREGVAAVLWPTATPAGDGEQGGPLRAPGAKDGLAERARELDSALAEAAQDLGLLLDVGARPPPLPRLVRDLDLIDSSREQHAWVISPRIERDGGELLLRIVAVPPDGTVALVREERVAAGRVAVRGVVMLRDLLRANAAPRRVAASAVGGEAAEDARPPAPGSGRRLMLGTLTLFGGYVGYALHTSSRSGDPRLLYPLMALGAGVGFGAASLAADEWEVGQGGAWYLASGAVWPTTSALMLSAGYGVKPESDRQAFGLVAGIGGLGAATAALARRRVGEGGALLAHSGGLLGAFAGGMGEYIARGSTQRTPWRGAGYGTSGGWLIGAALGAWLDPSSSRVLAIDLGVGLGALGGAAAASPLLLDNPTQNQERAWLGVSLAGAVAGGVVGGLLSRPPSKGKAAMGLLPVPGVVASARGPGGEVRPVAGLTWSGSW